MIRVVKQVVKLSSLIVLYLQVSTIFAAEEDNKQIQNSKFYSTNNRTLNSSLIQERSRLNQPTHQLNNANLNKLSDNLSLPSSIIGGGSIQSNGESDDNLELARPPSDIDGGEAEQRSNETSTVILEDLVNRFLEKNSDAMRKSSLIQPISNGGNTEKFSDRNKDDNRNDDNVEDDDYATTKQVNLHHHSNDGQTNDSFIGSEGSISTVVTTPSPFMQLISAQLNEGEQRNNDLQLSSQQESSDIEDADKHIQYDVIEPEPEQTTTQSKQKLHPRHVKNELKMLKLTNYTTDNNGTVMQAKREQQQQLSDYVNSQSIELGQNVSLLSRIPEQNQIFSMNTTSDENSNKNELFRQQQQQQTNSSSAPRIVQARSMSNIVASLNKTPQYTRPPYATYDQFSHRSSDMSSNNKQQVFNEPQAATPSFIASTSTTDGAPSSSSSNSTTIQQSGIGNKTNSSNVQDAATLVNSISRISSQLASDTAKQVDSAKQRQQQMMVVEKADKIQELQQNVDEENNNNNNNKFQQQQQQQLQKLTTSDQLVELNPIPSSDQAVPSGSGEQMQLKQGTSSLQDGVDRFYFSKENQLFNYFSPPNTLSARGQSVGVDKYHNTGSNNNFIKDPVDQLADSSSNVASNFFNINEISSNHHQQQLAKLAGQYPGHENKLNSIVDSRSNHEQQYDKLLNERMREGQLVNQINNNNNNNNNNPDKHHYAASLINVTAPMILPLSATEAMESTLSDQAAKNLLHQVSGFLRLPSSASDQVVKSTATATATATKLNQPPRSSQYYVTPLASSSSSLSSLPSDSRLPTNQQSIYSQPANQFSPPKTHSTSNEAISDSYLEERMRLNRNGYILAGRKPPVGYSASQLNGGGGHVSHQANQTQTQTTHQASGFRSPLQNPTTIQAGGGGSSSSLGGASSTPIWPTRLPTLSNYLSGGSLSSQMAAVAAAASERPPTTINNMLSSSSSSSIATPSSIFTSDSSRINSNGASSTLAAITNESQLPNNSTSRPPPSSSHSQLDSQQPFPGTTTTGSMNGMINLGPTGNNNNVSSQSIGGEVSSSTSETSGLTRPIFNLTRVEHISAECSNDLIRTVIIFNGTFKGIIYSSGYVRDPSCVYINGTGKTRYQFNIRLNQCGTLGRQELHPPVGPNEIRRRDQVMWNTLSIQYNPIIEQEWDEHFRVSCEYGSDFWKTVSFNPFNVETNTGSPVVFTVDPPQCQMEILRGHGMVGPRQEAVSGPVTVGDPLTLLIHMKSEKAGYDILVKNCIAHNGGHQKMQLIDNNGCVVNERFISPFRGTYNDNDMKHVTLYSYLKAFRFTGSPVLYLECEIHMCQSSCPPQMCYWRRLSKRSAGSNETRTTTSNGSHPMLGLTQYHNDFSTQEFSTDDELSTKAEHNQQDGNDDDQDDKVAHIGNKTTNLERSKKVATNKRQFRMLNLSLGDQDDGYNVATGNHVGMLKSDGLIKGRSKTKSAPATSTEKPLSSSGQISDKVSLFQALEVRQEREPENAPFSSSYSSNGNHITALDDNSYFTNNNNTFIDSMSTTSTSSSLTCYRRAEILAFLFTTISIILVAISISIGFCWRAANLRKMQRQGKTIVGTSGGLSSANLISRMSSINNLLCKNASIDTSSMSSCSATSPTSLQHQHQHQHPHHHHHHHHQHCNADSSWTPHPTNHQLRLSPILQHHSARHKERPL